MPRKAYSPSKEHLETAYKGAKAGLSYTEIARAIGIARSTLLRHKDAFSDSLKRGREELEAVDPNLENVENALLKRALGYEFKEIKTTEETVYPVHKPGDRANKSLKPYTRVIRKITTKKRIAPDTTAIIFYLVNRSDGRWRSINTPESLIGYQVDTEAILNAQAELDGYNRPENEQTAK